MVDRKTIKAVDKLFKEGKIYGYSVEGDEVVVIASSEAAEALSSLEKVKVIRVKRIPEIL